MSMLLSLWLPILISAVVVFMASAAAWMALPHHKADWRKLPDEEAFARMLRDTGVEAGGYMFPYHGSAEEMKSEEFQERWKQGPVGTLTVFGQVNMGANMLWTFVFFLIASVFIAYLATLAIQPGAGFMQVFRFVGTAGIMSYCFAGIPNAIWFKHKIFTNLLDGIAFGLLTGVVFALLWPGQ